MRTLVRLLAPLPALALLAGCGDSPETLYAKAQADFASENYVAARVLLSKALDKRPGDVAMLVLLMRAQLRLDDPDGAETTLRRLQKAGADEAQLSPLRAELALLEGDPKAALSLIGADATLEGWKVRAQAQLALGDEKGAVFSFEKGLALGDDTELETAYARYCLQSGDVDGAARIYDRMKASDPKAYETLVLAGDIAAARGQGDAAIAAYRAASAAFPQEIAPVIALANQYDAKGAFDDEAQAVAQAGKLAPDNPDVQVLQIRELYRQGAWEKIRLTLQDQDSDLDPASPIGLSYAEALLHTGHSEQARVMLNRATLRAPGNPYSQMLLGIAQLQSGDPQSAWNTLFPLTKSALVNPEALRMAEKAGRMIHAPEAPLLAVRLQPDRLKVHTALVDQGAAAMAAHDWSRAMAVYGKLSAEGPPDPEVFKRLALASDGLGQHAAAIGYADKSLALAPDDTDVLYVGGLVRSNAGIDLAAAERMLSQASSAAPQNRVLATALAKVKRMRGAAATS
ncbi:tetratricopeptide repeat protein [Novosphingobium sp. 9]|uniref:tetratricopeptide repeat protein n=1 Tax=Novosphingobium sp. 9 TaxID=2025349 RepID=UPI0021B50B09|nr:tetratricopeptide repeat protein [Novosphingobium sp. 9]